MTGAFRKDASLPRAFWIILAASLLGRIAFAAVTPLIPDEAYALAVGRSFSLSFFDHPPLGFWLPAVAERLGASVPLAFRVPSLVLGSLSLWLLFLIGRDLAGERAGLLTAGLGALMPALAVSGTFALPDAPLDTFLLATLLILLRIARSEDAGLGIWLAGGGTLALALASKYQAGLISVSVLIWMISHRAGRGWFGRKGFYLAVLVALLGLLPVLLWNASHDWASFRFQSARAGHALSLVNFARMAAAQALYVLPVLMFWSLAELFHRRNWSEPDRRLIVLVALGPIVMFNLIYLFSQNSLPHWSMPGWICLLPLVGARLSLAGPSRAKSWHFASAGVMYVLLLALSLHLATGWAARVLGGNQAWDRTAPHVSLSALRGALSASGDLDGTDVILAVGWMQAGYLAAALPDGPPVRALGDAHHFAYLDAARASGSAVLLTIVDAADAAARAQSQLDFARTIDPKAVALPVIPLLRGSEDHFRILAVRLAVPSGF